MIRDFQIPPTGFGPGSQPTEPDGSELEYMSLPQDMEEEEAEPLVLRNIHPSDRPSEPPKAPATEDQIDIPAFLRRQAN